MLPYCVNLKVTMQWLASFSGGLYFNSAWRLVMLRGFPDLPQFIQEYSKTIYSFFNLWLISILYSSFIVRRISHKARHNWFCVNNQTNVELILKGSKDGVQYSNLRVFELRPSPGILETRKLNVSNTGSVSVLRWGGQTPIPLGPLEKANLNHWTLSYYSVILSVDKTGGSHVHLMWVIVSKHRPLCGANPWICVYFRQ
jgi:hypothetical protein